MRERLEMKTVLLVTAIGLLSTTVGAREVIQSISWQELASGDAALPGEVIAGADGQAGPVLRLVHEEATPATLHLLTLERPAIHTSRYALEGVVRYDDVSSGSYLEMWNHFDEGAFFTRSLADDGPMARLEGSSPWRPFVLPFSNREGGAPPDKLVVNLALTGSGSVELGPLQLVALDPAENIFAGSGAWWTDRQAGLLGAVAGSALGILGALIGWLGSKGRARGVALGALTAIACFGVGSVALGVTALVRGQPYGVYYLLLLLGGLCTTLGFSLKRTVSRRYEQFEMRRMQALDA